MGHFQKGKSVLLFSLFFVYLIIYILFLPLLQNLKSNLDDVATNVVGQTALACLILIASVYLVGVIYTLLIANRSRMSIIYDNSVMQGSSQISPVHGGLRVRTDVSSPQSADTSLTARLLDNPNHGASLASVSDCPEVDL